MPSRDQRIGSDPAFATEAQESDLPPHEAIGREVRAATLATISLERSAGALAEAGRAALEAAETAFTKFQDSESVQREMAGLQCKKYCAHCCYKTVSATPAEVFHLAAYITETFSARSLTKLKGRLADLERKTRGMTPAERGQACFPCALLVARLCTAHPARPAACRGFNSRDLRACERSLKRRGVEIPVYAPQYRIFAQAHLGLRAGLAELGLASTHLELTAALRIALETPDAAERYLAGEPIFREAESP